MMKAGLLLDVPAFPSSLPIMQARSILPCDANIVVKKWAEPSNQHLFISSTGFMCF
jgi:hypothetical protein